MSKSKPKGPATAAARRRLSRKMKAIWAARRAAAAAKPATPSTSGSAAIHNLSIVTAGQLRKALEPFSDETLIVLSGEAVVRAPWLP